MPLYLIAICDTCRGIRKGRIYTQTNRWACRCGKVTGLSMNGVAHNHGPVVQVAEAFGNWGAFCRICREDAPGTDWHPLSIFRELNDSNLDEVPEQYADGTPRERERASVRELERILRET